MIRAFHTAWSAPLFARDRHAKYGVEDFELLTAALSALEWRRCNGPIDLFCDPVAHAYYEQLGLLPLWDEIHPLPLDVPFDPSCFWAAGKLLALRRMDAPCAMIDTDFIVWQPLEAILSALPLAVIHREPLVPDIYPDPHGLRTRAPFDLSAFDLAQPAANTAFSWFADPDFKNRYCDAALRFMEDALPDGDRLTYMVFAEQRLLPMLAAQDGVPLAALADLSALFTTGQNFFTHTWGYKNVLRADPAERERFCRRCAARISRDHPAHADRLAAVGGLSTYFDN